MSDQDLIDEANENARLFWLMCRTNQETAYAIDAFRRPLIGAICWGHLLEAALCRDEARALLAAAVKR